MKIAIIGTGNLGSSIAKGLITNNAITTLYLTKRNVSGLVDFEGYKNVFLTARQQRSHSAIGYYYFCRSTCPFRKNSNGSSTLFNRETCVDFYHYRLFNFKN